MMKSKKKRPILRPFFSLSKLMLDVLIAVKFCLLAQQQLENYAGRFHMPK